ncbi:MAG: TfoX/Sxy family protein, partial [Vicinamibacterales bacterium]
MSGKPARGTLPSLKGTQAFRAFVLEQLSGVWGLQDRSMFGGVGIYSGDVFFALIARDVLHFKVDDTNRAEYEAAGSKPFKPYADRAMTMPYYPVPVEVLEDAGTLVEWAKRSIAVAKKAKPPAGG